MNGGAISYLAESKFGRNEFTITQNTSSSYYTGAGNYKGNQNQSTTGNFYGVYDMVGSTFKFSACYIANNQNANGYQFASTDKNLSTTNNETKSTEYATVYKHNSTSDTDTNNYGLSLNKIFGDAICETSIEASGKTSWHSASSLFPNSSTPFFVRGGNYRSDNPVGSFYFGRNAGIAGGVANLNACGSRVICIVK